MVKWIESEVLVGKKFNNYTVLSVTEEDSVKGRILNCICDCGKEVSSTYAVIKNNQMTCDCQRREEQEIKIGEVYNNLTIIGTDISNPKNVIAQCTCGNIKSVIFKSLLLYKIKACGCLGKAKSAVGEVHNRYTITKDLPQIQYGKNRYRRVEAVCQCGNVRELTYKDLKSEKIKSCGCYAAEKIRKINVGEIFDKWTVLSEGTPRYTTKGKVRTVNLECECGNIKDNVTFKSLYDGRKLACICDKKEKIERYKEPLPISSDCEKWIEALGFDGYYISDKGRVFSTKGFNKYVNTEKRTHLKLSKGMESLYFNIAKVMYKSFISDYDEVKYILIPIDNDIYNITLDNLFLAAKLPNGSNWVNKIVNGLNASCVRGGRIKIRERNLTVADVINQYKEQDGLSAFLKLPLDLIGENRLLAVSIDRIKNDEVYIKENIRLVTRFENMGRNNNTYEDFETFCKTYLLNAETPHLPLYQEDCHSL